MKGKIASRKDRLPLRQKLTFSLRSGPSRWIPEERRPREAWPWNCSMSPSFEVVTRTEDILPPYLAGKSPLYRSVVLRMSWLNMEMKPRKWPAQYSGAPSSRMRFWSISPPRTEKPEDPSLGAWTPGSIWMTLMMSLSPRKAGTFSMVPASMASSPVWARRSRDAADSDTMTAASSRLTLPVRVSVWADATVPHRARASVRNMRRLIMFRNVHARQNTRRIPWLRQGRPSKRRSRDSSGRKAGQGCVNR